MKGQEVACHCSAAVVRAHAVLGRHEQLRLFQNVIENYQNIFNIQIMTIAIVLLLFANN